MYETSVENSILARETERYRPVFRVAADNVSGVSANEVIDVNFATDEEGFYIAIQDETVCIWVERLIVFYHVCPRGSSDLAFLPQTIAPPTRRMSQPLVVTAQCMDGASHVSGGVVRLNCNQGGVWSAGSGCRCNPGSYSSANRSSCIGIIYS
jgi:hypothetical protein